MRLQDPARVQETQLQDTFSQLSSHVVFAAPKFHIDSTVTTQTIDSTVTTATTTSILSPAQLEGSQR